MSGRRAVLLGDSILDNKRYVAPGEQGVHEQLCDRLADWTVEMRAEDGATTVDILERQTDALTGFDVIVLSAGGNDALDNIEVLDGKRSTTSREALLTIQKLRAEFQRRYSALLAKLSGLDARAVVLTIYSPKFSTHGMEMEDELAAEAALSVFNDVIQQTAAAQGCAVLDIRPLFTDGSDFANPIEPSAKGGAKLADAIAEAVRASAP